MVIPQSQIVFEKQKPAEFIGPAEDLDEDEHFDDVITTTEGGHSTDNELNLHSFKYNHRDSGICLVNDSELDSDAGS